ncbi:hypothetical protein WR25_15647 [Diploscapter pachys]|uniref:Uncharacterized protein n=1 Tax=Diploscapter pachys TaxID=2018661 RepID=A0A2A2KUR8_9BILA|nr:hypothetical protein WR25_15647 [Diploscapter pachys]
MRAAFPRGTNAAEEDLGDEFNSLHLDTRILTSRAKPLENVDPVIVPIYHSTTYRYKSVEQFNQPNHASGSNYLYQRSGNPTTENVEIIINEIEKGNGALLYNSGLAASSAVFLEYLEAGSHMISMCPLFSGTVNFMTEVLMKFGVEITFVDFEKEGDNFTKAVEDAVKPNTKMIFIEVMTNPAMNVPDISALIELANKRYILFFIDATFVSPYNIQPLTLGADIVMHSCSKYIGGHHDVVGGCVTVKKEDNWRRLKLQQSVTGSAMAPFEAALIARGLKTLALRTDRISDNAMAIARYLEKHPKVHKVYYAGLESNPFHKNAKKYLKKYSGMMGFDVGTTEKAIKLAKSVRVITLAVSLGGTESLIEHHLSMSSKARSAPSNYVVNIPEGLLRFSVGIENVDDLIKDLEQALDQI